MTHAIRINEFGGPENLEFVEVELGDPGPGQVRVAHTAVGLNYIDTHIRTGMYPVQLPSGLGGEAAGTVVSVGEGVEHVAPGDRIAYASSVPPQAYSEECVMDAKALLKLPDGIDDETAAAMMLKGLTSWYLLRRTYEVHAGDWILLYAAAGGVGTIAAQWAKHLGARVIGVVSTEEKREAALAHGCEEVLLSDSNIVEAVRELTNGDGVPVVYDGVGAATFEGSIDSLRAQGKLVGYGNASGNFPKFDPFLLMDKGSLSFQRTNMNHFISCCIPIPL